MNTYDPLQAPEPKEWLALDETEKSLLIEKSHIRAGVKLPNRRLHSTIHVIVENQLAMGESPEARRALARLLADGLDRHDALHAIGSVLTGHIYNLLKKPKGGVSIQAYCRALESLTAEKWFTGYSEPQ